MNIAIATKEYGNGKICIISDRISGYRNGHGEQPSLFYSNLFKYIGNNDIVSIGIVDSIGLNYYTYLDKYNVTYDVIDLQTISTQIIQYDIIYFIGLPEKVDIDCSNSIESYINNGGGVIIEVPNRDGDINILSSIENIYCAYERPTLSKAAWTENGLNSDLYDSELYVAFLTTLDQSYFNSWNILMNDVQITYENSLVKQIQNIEVIGSCVSNFGMSYTIAYQNGILELKERLSSSSTSSNSSSSVDDPESWDICDDIIAQYKLNENYDTAFIWDSTGNFNNIGSFYDLYGNNMFTKNNSVYGKINRAISFSNNSCVKTNNNTIFNFTNGIADFPFSISFWFNWQVASGYGNSPYILNKTNVWEVRINRWFLGETISVKLYNGSEHYFQENFINVARYSWNYVTITYDTIDIKIYVNNIQTSPYAALCSKTVGYITMANDNSSLFIGDDITPDVSSNGFTGYLDNIIIVNKALSSIEMEGLYNGGYGTEDCNGIYEYISSSSSSNSSSSSTSSISSFSSMSKSSSSSSTWIRTSSSSNSSSSSSSVSSSSFSSESSPSPLSSISSYSTEFMSSSISSDSSSEWMSSSSSSISSISSDSSISSTSSTSSSSSFSTVSSYSTEIMSSSSSSSSSQSSESSISSISSDSTLNTSSSSSTFVFTSSSSQSFNPLDYMELLAHFENNMTDSSPNGQTLTKSAAINYTSGTVKFGTYALSSPYTFGHNMLATSEQTYFDINNKDFTFDYWINCGGNNSPRVTISKTGVDYLTLNLYDTASLKLYAHKSGTTYTGTAITARTGWAWICVVKEGTSVRIYKDAILINTITLATADDFDTPSTASVKWISNDGSNYDYLDEVRFMNGVALDPDGVPVAPY